MSARSRDCIRHLYAYSDMRVFLVYLSDVDCVIFTRMLEFCRLEFRRVSLNAKAAYAKSRTRIYTHTLFNLIFNILPGRYKLFFGKKRVRALAFGKVHADISLDAKL